MSILHAVSERAVPAAQQAVRERCFHPSNTFVEFPRIDLETSIPHCFEAQVRNFPERIAIQGGDSAISYAQLNQWANRIAHGILEVAERQETVALLLENGSPVIAAILGVLKAGGINVPLDPLFPEERLCYMLDDAQATLLITNSANWALATAIAPPGCPLLNLDELSPHLPTENPEQLLSPDDLTHIIYTSGSTGAPKGIMHNHRDILHNIMYYTNIFRVCREDRVTMMHSSSFNSSTVDMFLPLLNGASVHPWDFRARGFTRFADWLAAEAITIFIWIPTPFRHFIETMQPRHRFPHLRVLSIGSEPVSLHDIAMYKAHFADECLFVNRLGTTETNNFRLFFVGKETELTGSIVPVGYHVDDKEVLLFDEAGAPVVAPGQIGEIGVRSRYMSPGYWRKPEQTRKAFLDDPAGGEARIYLTGDLGRLREDGCLEYFGRKDFQVKIRGHRIEVAEVEMHLRESGFCKEAVVLTRADLRGQQQLVAYVVPAEGQSPTSAQLHQMLAQQLPDYMVPAAFMVLETLPTTPSGKVDRKNLPLPGPADMPQRGHSNAADAPPKTATEKRLVELWSQLLGIKRIGIHQSFFELGGHSLSAAHLFNTIHREFGKQLPLSSLLHAPTISQLAALIDREGEQVGWDSLVPLNPHGERRPLFFVHAHGGNVLGYQELSHHLGPDQPFYGLQAQGLDGIERPRESLAAIAARYVEAIRTVQPHGPYQLGGWCFGGSVAYEMAHQLRQQGEEVAHLFLVQSTHPHYSRNPANAQGVRRLILRTGHRIAQEVQRVLETERRWFHVGLRLQRVVEGLQIAGERMVERLPGWLRAQIPRSLAYRLTRMGDNHQHALHSHTFPPYDGHVVLVRATKQRWDAIHDVHMGWKPFVRGRLDIHEVPGYQLGMLSEPRVQQVAAHLRQYLET